MSKKRTQKILIRDIDRSLFSYLYAFKVAMSDQIKRDIYKNISHQALYKRLNKLIQFGYIEASYRREDRVKLVYSLTQKGFKEFITPDAIDRIQLKSENITHDLDLNNLAYQLKRLAGFKAYLTENLLLSANDENLKLIKRSRPDALLKINLGGENYTFAIECERSLKYHKRYRPFFQKYLSLDEIDAVLIVTKDHHILNRLMEKEKAYLARSPSKFFYATISDIKKSCDQMEFMSAIGEKLLLPMMVASDDCHATDEINKKA